MELPIKIDEGIHIRGRQAEAWEYLTDKKTNEILYGGGAGGGKSYLGCIWHIHNRLTYPNTRGMIGRSKIANIEQSTLKTLFMVAQQLGKLPKRDYNYNSHKHVITWENGSETILKDLFAYPADPDFIALGSTEYTDVFLDEVNELTMKAVDLVNSRIRWKLSEYNLIPKMLMTCNPAPGWVKNTWIEKDGKPAVLKKYQKYVRALVTDNPDKGFVDIYKTQLEKMNSEYDKQRLLYGDWDTERDVENPFAFQYDPQYHLSKTVRHIPDYPITISIDFNLNPFAVTFSHFWEDLTGYHDWTFDEASIEKGSIPDMIDLIKTRYGQFLHMATLTGDPSGKAGQLSERDNASYYLQLQRGLGLTNHQMKVRPKAPTHSASRSDVNYVLYQSKQVNSPFEFKINPTTCPNTARDFRIVQCDATGSIIKGNRKDVSQQADFMDTIRYKVDLVWQRIIIQHQRTHVI